MHKRSSGILLHITSLPSDYGVGNLGPSAYRFADFLKKARQSHWQLLPLTPPNSVSSGSPYDCSSAFAASPLLISPKLLYRDNLLKKNDIANPPNFPKTKTDYKKAHSLSKKLLDIAVENFRKKKTPPAYRQFAAEHAHWLNDYALFNAFAGHFKTTDWSKWHPQIKNRNKSQIKNLSDHLTSRIEKEKILQYLFYSQFFRLKKYCRQNAVSLIGDIPLYLSYNSADLWANQPLFKLNRSRKPSSVSGVPPDYFSKTGQLWGNPLYDWKKIKQTGYKWWINRMTHNLKMYDIVRIDHFRGLVKYWQVPAKHKTAVKGRWITGPGRDFFETVYNFCPSAQLIAEDLGYITPDVKKLVADLNLPGMKVLHFAFDYPSGKNPYLPHNHPKNSIVYTATHDNNTTKGWFDNDLSAKNKNLLRTYLNKTVNTKNVTESLITTAMTSVADIAIIPMQDILNLPASARMNKPSSRRGNWQWRMTPDQLKSAPAKHLADLTKLTNRT